MDSFLIEEMQWTAFISLRFDYQRHGVPIASFAHLKNGRARPTANRTAARLLGKKHVETRQHEASESSQPIECQ